MNTVKSLRERNARPSLGRLAGAMGKSWLNATVKMNPRPTTVPRRAIVWATDEIEGNLVEFDVRWFKRLRGPGIYMINGWSGMLYVGMASNLLARISSPEHDAVVRALRDHVSQVLMIPAKSLAHARDMETDYIRATQPKYNLVGKFTEFHLQCMFEVDFKRELEQRLG